MAYARYDLQLLAAAVLIAIILLFSVGENRIHALQQVAGKIEISLLPGDTSTFQWGLLSDSDAEKDILLRAEGTGSEFMSVPDSIKLEPGKLGWVTVTVSIPKEHPGSVHLTPSLFATELGEAGGTTVINIQMQKQVRLEIMANPDPSLAKALEVSLGDYLQLIRVGDKEIQLLVKSSSTVSNFEFDEFNRKLSFTVSGTGRGSTIVYVDSVLKGPYVVNVDQAISSDHEILISEDGKESIKISHDQNAHDIIISGTSVVPEFSIPVVAMAVTLTVLVTGVRLKRHVDGVY